MIINDNSTLLNVSIELRKRGFMVRRHFNEFFTFDKGGYVGIIIVGLNGEIEVYLPTWKKTSTKVKNKIVKAIKSALNINNIMINFVTPEAS